MQFAQSPDANVAFETNILVNPRRQPLVTGELGVYGGGCDARAPTPRIDKLATRACVSQQNMEAQCTPSRSPSCRALCGPSGTHSVPFGGVADGLTQWEVTMAESFVGGRAIDGAGV